MILFDIMTVQENCQPKLPSPATMVKKLHGLAEELCKTPKIGCTACTDIEVAGNEVDTPCSFGATILRSPDCAECSYFSSDPSAFLIRGENYLKDRHKVKANRTLMELVGADWLRSDKREDDLASRPGGIVQKYEAKGGSEFFFIVNMQIPGNTRHNLVMYYMTKTPLESTPLLEKFVNGDDAYRNSRFKLIPYISKGSWIVKQSVGKKACLVGQALEATYIRGRNYLELDIDVGSSSVARGVSGLVLGYLSSLVIEMAFLIQAETEDELPEVLLGTCRYNYLDASKAFLVEE
ncbi:Protein ENHANCED DISEASE RESISTANCE 2, C-terminal [Dillenia turbinata]|uniref:Protein ENHANCED DISEASE RESISTANCE 2, C-terminal n=1 Tax=Dillenia turbinata TaxID=194707 RepID=A0AAN8VPM6_9MAGN